MIKKFWQSLAWIANKLGNKTLHEKYLFKSYEYEYDNLVKNILLMADSVPSPSRQKLSKNGVVVYEDKELIKILGDSMPVESSQPIKKLDIN